MRASISQLAQADDAFVDFLHEASNFGFHYIEIVPTKVDETLEQSSLSRFHSLKKMLDEHELKVSGLQSFLYRRPDLQVFDKTSWKKFVEHFEIVTQIANILETRVLVFGAPQNRVRGEITEEYAREISIDFFRTLEPVLRDSGTVLTIEPNAQEYGCDFLTTYSEVVDFINLMQSDVILAQIDVGSMKLENEHLQTCLNMRMPCHFHISAPSLGNAISTHEIAQTLSCLVQSSYREFVVYETRCSILSDSPTRRNVRFLLEELAHTPSHIQNP